jgi:hypothetical protein
MATDHDNNRSSALSPESLAAINQAVSSAVEGILKGLLPAFTTAMQPPVDPKAKAREDRDLREKMKWKEDEKEIQKAQEDRKSRCQHKDKRGQSSIRIVHNQPDRQTRGVCMLCMDWITPPEWRIGPADEKNPRGKAYLAPAHKDYATVIQLESME